MTAWETFRCKLFHRKHWGYKPAGQFGPGATLDGFVRTGSLMDRYGDRHSSISIDMVCARCDRSWWHEIWPVAILKIKLGRNDPLVR